MNQKKSGLLNILINLAIPIIILTKFSGEEQLGARLGLIIALLFPLAYGTREFIKEKKFNLFSGLGIISVILTGIIGLLKLPNTWLAWKEASIPLAIAITILTLQKVGRPLLEELLKGIFNFKKIFTTAKKKKVTQNIEKELRKANYILATTFLASATANYILTKIIVTSKPGTTAYNAEIGTLTGLSIIIIALPFILAFILLVVFLIRNIQKETGMKLEEIVE